MRKIIHDSSMRQESNVHITGPDGSEGGPEHEMVARNSVVVERIKRSVLLAFAIRSKLSSSELGAL